MIFMLYKALFCRTKKGVYQKCPKREETIKTEFLETAKVNDRTEDMNTNTLIFPGIVKAFIHGDLLQRIKMYIANEASIR